MARHRYVVRHLTRRGAILLSVLLGVLPTGLAAWVVVAGSTMWQVVITLDWLIMVVPLVILIADAARTAARQEAWGETRFSVDEEGVFFGDSQTFVSWSRMTSLDLVRVTEIDSLQYNLVVTDSQRQRWTQEWINEKKALAALKRFAPAGLPVTRGLTGPAPSIRPRPADPPAAE
jgi:hypothetical protein